jgi:hypothetical protein
MMNRQKKGRKDEPLMASQQQESSDRFVQAMHSNRYQAAAQENFPTEED